MRFGKWIFALGIALGMAACSNNAVEEVENEVIVPDALKEVDDVLQGFGASSQMFRVSGKQNSFFKTNRGTIVRIDPTKLETKDGSPLAGMIDVSVLEIGEKVNMMLNNITSNGGDEVLDIPGAFEIKIWSKGIAVKVREEGGVRVELPRWSDKSLNLYYGRQDSLGQIGWKSADVSLTQKNLEKPTKPVNPEDSKKVEDITKQEYDEYLLGMQRYKKEMGAISEAMSTYSEVSLSKLGWIGIAHEISGATTNVNLHVNNPEGISRARFYAVVQGSNVIIAGNYRASGGDEVILKNLPLEAEITLIGIAIKEGQPQVFSQKTTVTKDMKVEVQMMQEEQQGLRRAVSMAG